MLKKTITYKDFNEETVSEDFFFHLTQAELIKLEVSHKDGLAASMQRMLDSDDGESIMKEFDKIILGAYGVKSMDGKRFIKNDTLRDEFQSSAAYSALFMELMTNTDAQTEFINGIIPSGLAEEVAKLKTAPALVPVPEPEQKQEPTEVRIVTREEVMKMPQEELGELGVLLASGQARFESPEEEKG